MFRIVFKKKLEQIVKYIRFIIVLKFKMLKIVCICLLLAVVTSTNNVMLVTEYNYDKEPSTNIFRQNCVNYDDNDDENTNNIINSYDFCELGNIIHKNGLISTELLSV